PHRPGPPAERDAPQQRPDAHVRDGDRRRVGVPIAGADARFPPEVPALVVRLEPELPSVLLPHLGLRVLARRPLSIDRRGAGRPPRIPVPGRRSIEPLAATGQMAACHPALHRSVLPGYRRRGGGDHRLVRDSFHGHVSTGPIRLRGRCFSMEQPRNGLRPRAGDRPVPAVQPPLTRYSTTRRPPRFTVGESIGAASIAPFERRIWRAASRRSGSVSTLTR